MIDHCNVEYKNILTQWKLSAKADKNSVRDLIKKLFLWEKCDLVIETHLPEKRKSLDSKIRVTKWYKCKYRNGKSFILIVALLLWFYI